MANKTFFDYSQNSSPARTLNLLAQPDALSLYQRFTIAQLFSALQASDIPYTEMSHIYFVGKHGNDSNGGLHLEQAKLTFSSAMTSAVSGDSIICLDGGVYNESIDVKDGVNIFAPNATLDLSGQTLDMGECSVLFHTIKRTSGSGNAIIFDGSGGGRQKLTVEVFSDTTSGNLMRFSNSSIPIVSWKEMYISGGGVGVCSNAGTVHYHLSGIDAYLDSNGATFLRHANPAFGIVQVQHIVETGTRTGTVAIDIDEGSIDIFTHTIIADTAVDLAASTAVNILAASVTGTVNNAGGVYNKCIATDKTQTFGFPILIESPSNKDYTLIINVPKNIIITKVTSVCTSGTCTATIKINNIALGGASNSVSTTEQEQAHSSNNTAVAGDTIVLTVSNNSSCKNMSIMIEYTSELD